MVKAKAEQRRIARLVPLPFITFAEIQAAGFQTVVCCTGCHRWRSPELEGRGHRRFAGARFRCRECVARGLSGFGHLTIRSPPRGAGQGAGCEVADLRCGGCVPYWEICDIDARLAPWIVEDGQCFVCPGCRRRLWPGFYHRLPDASEEKAAFAAHLLDPRGVGPPR